MRTVWISAAAIAGIFLGTAAFAECKGSNGRGWGSGKGAGQFEMTMADKTCQISFPGFVNDAAKTRVPATDVKLTRAPASGKIGIVAGKGLIYTPNPGFKGSDSFCTVNTAKGQAGKLSGCITVTVR